LYHPPWIARPRQSRQPPSVAHRHQGVAQTRHNARSHQDNTKPRPDPNTTTPIYKQWPTTYSIFPPAGNATGERDGKGRRRRAGVDSQQGPAGREPILKLESYLTVTSLWISENNFWIFSNLKNV
jgi:hypothetical protein